MTQKEKINNAKKKAIERIQDDTHIKFSDKTRVIMDSLLDLFIKSYFGVLPDIQQKVLTDDKTIG